MKQNRLALLNAGIWTAAAVLSAANGLYRDWGWLNLAATALFAANAVLWWRNVWRGRKP